MSVLKLLVMTITVTTCFGKAAAGGEDDTCKLVNSKAKMGQILPGITNVADLEPDSETMKEIRSKLVENGVIVIRNQNLTRQQQVDFTSKLGRGVIRLPDSFNADDLEIGFPEITRASNYFYNGTWKGHQNCFGCYWHKDGDFHRSQFLASILYADTITSNNSATIFLDNCGVYGQLTRKTRQQLADSVFTVSVRNIPDYKDGKEEDLALYPDIARHPGLYRHEGNGRQCVYITLSLVTEDGVADHLTDALKEVTERGEKYTHYWRRGDLVIWDNLGVMHRAGAKGFSGPGDGSPRILYRTQAFL